ncbi:FAD-binding oxidoreductase [Sinorhizobium meliloti]|uniref:FAD-binding oxidoreductase n=1 Tax=Rhizobium meliloti TaxID=382 RepID=UPI000405A28B|nr:FAD-binding oxidoreductase [Sinorhizobium meliloti]PST20286.1 FAD-binding oxidoreductase [Mesorhizobium loti]ASP68587.1 FAD-binding oxidoreductase [Sinorhizobium meliloti]MBP2468231.1 FAD/FMN-containing dehydrogenase [Sinorhizobium meliloti]MDE3813726.1 FAD-binding oxidoreductase [Sinorhizobium meliloti]MDE4616378.1 FAD-binding oxidoreductase [Sinorhizobium meliloti]
MNDMSLTNLQSGITMVSAAAIEAFTARLRGRVLIATDAAYYEARTIWNGMIDRRPGLIVQCAGAADVVNAVRFAAENQLLVAVRGGGHNIAGNAVCDGGMVIDLTPMKSVRVDATTKTAWVEPGATLADLDMETQAFRLALPTGINSTTGIAGLTLGGGFGWITRKFGLTIDNLLSADVVTANGELVRASPTEHRDLFWAIRGGGGNFGVVTTFEFRLHELGPEVLSGLVIHPFAEAGSVLQQYRQALENAPDELTCWVVMRQAPPLPFLPTEWHGKEVVVLAMCYCGDLEAGEKAMAGLRAIGNPIADVVSPHPFVGWQQAFDPLLAPGARNYWKSHDFMELSDQAIGILTESIRQLPGPECEIFIAHVGGAAGRVAPEETAFPQRNSHFVMNVHGRWRDPAMDQACIDWARHLFEAAKPHAAGTAYVNFMPEDEMDRVEAAYGANYGRLVEIKRHYDPLNLFRMNQNVRPIEERGAA